MTPRPQGIASVAAADAVEEATSSKIGALQRSVRLARSTTSRQLKPGVSDQVPRRVGAFGKLPNLLKEGELILHRGDFYHLTFFEALDREVSHLGRLAGGLDAPV